MSLKEYDWIVINSSAGKDSQAMTEYVCHLARCHGVLDRVVLVHADLGEVEWKGTRDLAELHAKAYGIRFEAIARPQGNLLAQIEARGMFPDSKNRYCTSDQKRGQVAKIITKLGAEYQGRLGRPVRILNCMGFRKEESPARAKRHPFIEDKRLSTKQRKVDTWLPIHEWTVAKVWDTIKLSGVPYHFAYDLGMPRLSCCFCIFAPRSALLLAGKHNPELLDKYVKLEAKIGHTFRHKFAIAEVQRDLAAGVEPLKIQDWTM